jgi:hypothetical protein
MLELEPSKFYLGKNYPDPFNEKTTIKYCISYKTIVALRVYNSGRKEISKLVDEEKNAGTYAVTWDAKNFPAGIYFYQLETNDFNAIKKMVLLR